MPAKKEKVMNGEDDFPEDFLKPSPTIETTSLSRQQESTARINEAIEEMVRLIDAMSTMSMDTIDRHIEVLQDDEKDGHGNGDILEPVDRQETEQKDDAEDNKEETSDDDSQRDEEEIIENGEAPSTPPNSPFPGPSPRRSTTPAPHQPDDEEAPSTPSNSALPEPSRKQSATPTPHQDAKKPRSNIGRPRKPSAIQIVPKGILDLKYNSMGNKGIWFVVKMVDGTIELKKEAELAAYSAQMITLLKKQLYAEKISPSQIVDLSITSKQL